MITLSTYYLSGYAVVLLVDDGIVKIKKKYKTGKDGYMVQAVRELRSYVGSVAVRGVRIEVQRGGMLEDGEAFEILQGIPCEYMEVVCHRPAAYSYYNKLKAGSGLGGFDV